MVIGKPRNVILQVQQWFYICIRNDRVILVIIILEDI